MLSYQHIYHAGNFADVQKHLKLIEVLLKLTKDNNPITWLDTHAGRGLYNLQLPEAQKIKEYKSGFLSYRKKAQTRKNLTLAEQKYLEIVESVNKNGGFNIYPGSSYIAAKILRPQDQIIACELHKGEITHLRKSLAPYKNITVRQEDGYKVLTEIAKSNSYGGLMIDPSYEIKTEYTDIATHVKNALNHWNSAQILIWVPLLPPRRHVELYEALSSLPKDRFSITIDEKVIRDPDDPNSGRGLYGSGMIYITQR